MYWNYNTVIIIEINRVWASSSSIRWKDWGIKESNNFSGWGIRKISSSSNWAIRGISCFSNWWIRGSSSFSRWEIGDDNQRWRWGNHFKLRRRRWIHHWRLWVSWLCINLCRCVLRRGSLVGSHQWKLSFRPGYLLKKVLYRYDWPVMSQLLQAVIP